MFQNNKMMSNYIIIAVMNKSIMLPKESCAKETIMFIDILILQQLGILYHRRRNRGVGGVGAGGAPAPPPPNIKWGPEYVSATFPNIWPIVQQKPRHRCNVPIKN